MTDAEGPGVRADRASKKRLLVFQGIYALAATALMVGLMSGRRDPVDGFPPFTPEAGVAGAVLLPLLTLVTMRFALRMLDEVFRRIVVDAWAVSFVVTIFGATSWLFLVAGGVVPEPPARAVFLSLLAGGGVTVLITAVWLRWRRVGDLGAV
ncbi:hypothetical protein [Altererythrobacter sp. Root672]|uniref:hypothetical protein n=1 Tax=Altererythrobacter sp. Root672 TaxID=1736584 RepID=UPI0006F3BFA8|nr:hypothetical protein [Altererythrobacter sp. Root672]KRA84314.1 hypothetical protein ASD76_10140 [Altererythrobacter sp. Root672]